MGLKSPISGRRPQTLRAPAKERTQGDSMEAPLVPPRRVTALSSNRTVTKKSRPEGKGRSRNAGRRGARMQHRRRDEQRSLTTRQAADLQAELRASLVVCISLSVKHLRRDISKENQRKPKKTFDIGSRTALHYFRFWWKLTLLPRRRASYEGWGCHSGTRSLNG